MKFRRQDGLGRFIFVLVFWKGIEAIAKNAASIKGLVRNYNHLQSDITINKVILTQKGYIQFLKYVDEVPPLTDYTFCLWLRSHNLTYSHPLLSYSMHEEERLIRVWISPYGTSINLEILGIKLFKIPLQLKIYQWYHICQSWSSKDAIWILYLNGKLKASGIEPQLRGATIKGEGDIVVGQEYTDFDKGLNDGIEGDIFGFNFVLSPSQLVGPNFPSSRRHFDALGYPRTSLHFPSSFDSRPQADSLIAKHGDVLDFNVNNLRPFYPVGKMGSTHKYQGYHPPFKESGLSAFSGRNVNQIQSSGKTLGLRLVELSSDCTAGRGAPVNGKGVLIHWTKSTVRVFGGAIMKNIKAFCVK